MALSRRIDSACAEVRWTSASSVDEWLANSRSREASAAIWRCLSALESRCACVDPPRLVELALLRNTDGRDAIARLMRRDLMERCARKWIQVRALAIADLIATN